MVEGTSEKLKIKVLPGDFFTLAVQAIHSETHCFRIPLAHTPKSVCPVVLHFIES